MVGRSMDLESAHSEGIDHKNLKVVSIISKLVNQYRVFVNFPFQSHTLLFFFASLLLFFPYSFSLFFLSSLLLFFPYSFSLFFLSSLLLFFPYSFSLFLLSSLLLLLLLFLLITLTFLDRVRVAFLYQSCHQKYSMNPNGSFRTILFLFSWKLVW